MCTDFLSNYGWLKTLNTIVSWKTCEGVWMEADTMILFTNAYEDELTKLGIMIEPEDILLVFAKLL